MILVAVPNQLIHQQKHAQPDAHSLRRRRAPPRDESQARRDRGHGRDDGPVCRSEEMKISHDYTCASANASASSSAATPASICSRSIINGGAITKWLSHELMATPFFIMAAAT